VKPRETARPAEQPPRISRLAVAWLLAASALAVAPHMTYQPAWVSIAFAVVWAWRAWLAWRGARRPSVIVTVGLAFIGTVATWSSFGTIFGREAGVVLVQLMLALKLLELTTTRDGIVAIYLGFFVVLTNFLYSQTIFMGAWTVGVVWLLVATLIAFHMRTPSPRAVITKSGMMLLQALPAMLVFFVLFPRMSGPLWGMPKDAYSSLSGLSEDMSPGTIGNLALSDAIAFRAEFDGPIPLPRTLYWRGIVLNEFDGVTWRPSPAAGVGPGFDVQPAAQPTTYRVTLEPHNRRWVFALDLPRAAPRGYLTWRDYQLRSVAPLTTRVRYEAISYLSYRAGLALSGFERTRMLRLPPGNERARELAGQLTAGAANAREAAVRVLAHFREQPFRYTLTPALLGQKPVEEFLLRTREGFCEHYAGAFTFLMRAAGVPARVVTGYQGGEVNTVGNYLIVRQSDAHAWSEIWIAGEGWVRVDPTAAVSPDRVERGMRAVIPDTGFIPALVGGERLAWLNSFRLSWDALNNQWNLWVLGYSQERQRTVLQRFGISDTDWHNLTVILLGLLSAGVLAALVAVLWRGRRKASRDRVVRAWGKFCAKLARAGVVRAPHEGPLDFAARVAMVRPEWGLAVGRVTELYVALRYGDAPAGRAQQLDRLVAEFSAR